MAKSQMSVWYHEVDPCLAVFSGPIHNLVLGIVEGKYGRRSFRQLCTADDLKASGWVYVGEFY